MESWLLFIIGIVLCVAELFGPTGFFLLILGLGTLFTGALTYLGAVTGWIAQATVFSVASLGIWYLFGDSLQRLLRTGEKEYEGLIGQTAIARESIAPGHKGSGEMWGSPWRLENKGESPLSNGDECEVVSSDGLLLHVKPKSS
jgi:membrane protein implicated in regulation of membrane protease activity